MRHPATRVLVAQSPPSAGLAPTTRCFMPGKSLSVNRLAGWSAVVRPLFDRLRSRAWRWPCTSIREPPGRVLATELTPQHLPDTTKVAKELTAYPCSVQSDTARSLPSPQLGRQGIPISGPHPVPDGLGQRCGPLQTCRLGYRNPRSTSFFRRVLLPNVQAARSNRWILSGARIPVPCRMRPHPTHPHVSALQEVPRQTPA